MVPDVRTRVDVAGRRCVAALVSYVRATAVVAVVDAVAIGIGLTVLGIPLAVPLAALVFLGAFIPIIGAVIGGGVAVLVALVANGPVAALIVLGIIVAVMQLEGHVLQPLLLGHAVKLHPLAMSRPLRAAERGCRPAFPARPARIAGLGAGWDIRPERGPPSAGCRIGVPARRCRRCQGTRSTTLSWSVTGWVPTLNLDTS